MNFTLAIYGPWERVIKDTALFDAFKSYINAARELPQISEIIYVQTESEYTPPSGLFDKICLTIKQNIFGDHCKQEGSLNFDFNLGFLITNIKTAHENANSNTIICHRCDIVPKDLNELTNIYSSVQNKKRFLVDYSLDHTCLIPYYLSDFFYIGPVLELDLRQIKKFAAVDLNQRIWNLSPMRFLTLGRIQKNYCYSEYAIWSFLYLKKPFKPMSQNNLFDLISFKCFSNTVEFVSRSKYFMNLGKMVDVNRNEINSKRIGFFSIRHIALSWALFVLRSQKIVRKRFIK